jgi:lipoate-protein ligase A
MENFRLIESGYNDAATNMAVDETLLLEYQKHVSMPTLRIYGWAAPAVSIGHSQDPHRLLNLETLDEKKVPLVRRPTGGGILFHDNEITYSVIASASDFSATNSVRDSFKKITGFLIEAYKMMGIQAGFSGTRPGEPHRLEEFCLARKEEYDIIAGGKKIGGNAQRRLHQTILQHGAIPLTYDKNSARIFLLHPEVLDDLKVTTLTELTGKKVSFHAMAETLIRAFGAHFHSRAIRMPLSHEESALVANLKKNKYENPRWNLNREFHD